MDVAVAALTGVTDLPVTTSYSQDHQASRRTFAAPADTTAALARQDEFIHAPADPSARGAWKLSDMHAVSEIARQQKTTRESTSQEHAAQQALNAAAEANSKGKAAPAITAVRASQLAAWRKTQSNGHEPAAPKAHRQSESDTHDAEPSDLPRYL
jgi:hypothetical protein